MSASNKSLSIIQRVVRNKHYFVVFIFICLFFDIACIDKGFAAGKAITLDDAYRLAISAHETVGISDERLFQAEKNLDKAKALILPTVRSEGRYTRYSQQKSFSGFLLQPDETRRFDLVITQPVYLGGKGWSSRRQAKMEVDERKKGLDGTKEAILMETAVSYFNVLKTQKEIEIKEAAIKRAMERKKVAASRFKVGEVTKTYLLREEAELAKAEAELIAAEGQLIDAWYILQRLTGIESDIHLLEPTMNVSVERDVEALINEALKRRQDYKQSIVAEDIASEGITYVKGDFLPNVTIEGVYSLKDQAPKTAFFLDEVIYAGFVVSYPIFEGGLRMAELAEAKSKLREAELQRLGHRRDIEIEVRTAYNKMKTLNAVMESYKKQILFARENYNLVFNRYKNGLATSVDIIDADATLISADRGSMNAAYDLQAAIIQLKYNTGVLLDELASSVQKID